jgi:hypothetical protein
MSILLMLVNCEKENSHGAFAPCEFFLRESIAGHEQEAHAAIIHSR